MMDFFSYSQEADRRIAKSLITQKLLNMNLGSLWMDQYSQLLSEDPFICISVLTLVVIVSIFFM